MKIMINPPKQWILEGISRSKKMEETVAICNGSVHSTYSENRKAQGECSTADDFEIFMKRGKMLSHRPVRNSWNKNSVEN
jgi:hypothetical protein